MYTCCCPAWQPADYHVNVILFWQWLNKETIIIIIIIIIFLIIIIIIIIIIIPRVWDIKQSVWCLIIIISNCDTSSHYVHYFWFLVSNSILSQAAQSRQPCVNSHQLSQWKALVTENFDPPQNRHTLTDL